MKDVESMLNEIKESINEIPVPDEEIEVRLRNALKNNHRQRSHIRSRNILIAAALILCVFVGFNYEAIAYYGKRFLGYDTIMNSTISKLNELGKGQEIGKSHTFKNGMIFTLDGVMIDENQLIVFYSIKKPDGLNDENILLPSMTIKGTFGVYSMTNGSGNINSDKTELKCIQSFEAPVFFERNLSLNINIHEDIMQESAYIDFRLDRTKAMGHTLKQKINRTVNIGKTNIYFESILATPTKTVIKGSLESIYSLIKDQMEGNRYRPKELSAELIADGTPVPYHGSGLRTDMNGMTFTLDYDALPDNINKLQLKLKSFSADHDAGRSVELQKGKQSRNAEIFNRVINISDVYEAEGDTFVTITTSEDVVLTRVYLTIDGKNNELKETVLKSYNKKPDGTVEYTRTLHFAGKGDKLALDIQRISYTELYNKVIDIPVK